MNKFSILIIFTAATTSLQCQTRPNFSTSFKIDYVYGDEALRREEMQFEIKATKVVGRITYPNTDKVLSSEVELNNQQINTINSFISLVEQYRMGNCLEKDVSSWVEYYFILKDTEKIEIRKFCDWQEFTFLSMKQVIFGDYLKSLSLKKHLIEVEYFKLVKGKWKENTVLDKLDLTSICVLTKIEQTADTADYIEFTELNRVVLKRKDRKIFYTYHLEFKDDNTYIFLEPYQNGTEFIYGHRFLIVESNFSKMKFSRA